MFRQWLERRRQERQNAAYCRGYGWAWAAFKVEGMSLAEVESYVFTDLRSEQSSEEVYFDLGAQVALEHIKHYEALMEVPCELC